MARIDRRGRMVISPRETEDMFLEIWEATDKETYDDIKSVSASPSEMVATLSVEEPDVYNMVYGRLIRRRQGILV